jgi:hypothetical protein
MDGESGDGGSFLLPPRMSAWVRFAVVCPAIVAIAFAQAVSRPETSTAATPPAVANGAVVMSPFEVNSDDDKGYAASTALAGTRISDRP